MCRRHLSKILVLCLIIPNTISSNSEEVDKECRTPNDGIGRCVPLKECPSLWLITPDGPMQEMFLLASICGDRTVPMVCCNKETNFELNYSSSIDTRSSTINTQCIAPNNKEGTCIPIKNCTSLMVKLKDPLQKPFLRESMCGGHYTKPLVCCETESSSLEEGANCRTPNNELGSCISIKHCTTLLDVVQTQDPIQLKFLKESKCGGHYMKPLVCCGKLTNYSSTEEESSIIDNKLCGLSLLDRILGGTTTSLTEFPWMALLRYRKENQLTFACGGSLISKRHVLTAAHCVTGGIIQNRGLLVQVRLGEHDTTKNPDCLRNSSICANPHLDVPVSKVIPHSQYDVNSRQRHNDIALVLLAYKVPLSDFIRPICLPNSKDVIKIGERLTTCGWGATEFESFSTVKQKVNLFVQQHSNCTEKYYSRQKINVTENQLCVGGEKGKDSCKGDSGGPLMKIRKGSSQWIIEGVVSLGTFPCGAEGWPGIYTRVGHYVTWIYDNIKLK